MTETPLSKKTVAPVHCVCCQCGKSFRLRSDGRLPKHKIRRAYMIESHPYVMGAYKLTEKGERLAKEYEV